MLHKSHYLVHGTVEDLHLQVHRGQQRSALEGGLQQLRGHFLPGQVVARPFGEGCGTAGKVLHPMRRDLLAEG